ncbi:MAG TPA: hypothetical protein VLF79_00025 [Candidatus Saccharimonadales bacterium]|nr:hypothetical protein [Candidatus Saccharimonadales bacterium]
MVQNDNTTGWVGWAYFAGFMMMFLGIFEGIAGLTAIFNSDFFLVTQKHLVALDFTAWGWMTLILGVIIFFAGIELFRTGAMWARIIAILLAGLSLIGNLAYIEAYPLWSITMMVIDALIIYALTVHGSELREY